MKLLSSAPSANMSMGESKQLSGLVHDLLQKHLVRYVLETGTYLGLGSTRFIADAFDPEHPPLNFYTIEASWKSWRAARGNLGNYSFVTPLWGHSVAVKKAVEFLKNDELLASHQNYPNVFIDDVDDPVNFYVREINGKLNTTFRGRKDRLLWLFDRVLFYAGENLLEKYLKRVKRKKPLIVLDSAGGVGYLEFQTVDSIMKSEPYYILLDDIHHIKHFRSLEHIKKNSTFTILGMDYDEGWLLAEHTP